MMSHASFMYRHAANSSAQIRQVFPDARKRSMSSRLWVPTTLTWEPLGQITRDPPPLVTRRAPASILVNAWSFKLADSMPSPIVGATSRTRCGND